jgi:hypothetical protein
MYDTGTQIGNNVAVKGFYKVYLNGVLLPVTYASKWGNSSLSLSVSKIIEVKKNDDIDIEFMGEDGYPNGEMLSYTVKNNCYPEFSLDSSSDSAVSFSYSIEVK